MFENNYNSVSSVGVKLEAVKLLYVAAVGGAQEK
jgi:hypothetical protein